MSHLQNKGVISDMARLWLYARTKQLVIIDPLSSQDFLLTSGVPQRSVLGPCLIMRKHLIQTYSSSGCCSKRSALALPHRRPLHWQGQGCYTDVCASESQYHMSHCTDPLRSIPPSCRLSHLQNVKKSKNE